jgi:hypothetical protein
VAHADGGPSTVIDLTQYFADSQNSASALTYSVVGDTSPALFSSVSVDSQADTLTLAYAPGAYGTADLTVQATNPQGLSTDAIFTLRSAATTVTLSNVTLDSQVNEGQTATLSGNLSGNGPLTLTVDWGDASDPDTFTYPAGTTSFSVTHQYLESADYGDGSGYTVELGMTDSLGMTAQQSASIYVAHVAPTLGNVTLTGPAGVSDIDVGDTGMLVGTVCAPNPQEGFTLDVDWGDGSTDTYTLDPGTTNFFGTHTFDSPSSGANLTLTDDYGSTATATAAVSVATPSLGDVSISTVSEGQPATLSGSIEGAGANNPLTLSVDWGDGTTPSTYTLSPGTPTFSEPHTYTDCDPSGSGYAVVVTLSDNYGDTDTQSATAVVNPVSPTIDVSSLQVAPSNEGSAATLSGNFTAVTAQADFEVQVDWGDGSGVDTLYYPPDARSFSDQHVYQQASTTGGYPVSVTVTDDEGGTDTAGTTAVVNDVAPTLSDVTITPSTPIVEGQDAVLSGSIAQAGLSPLTLNVNWKDGDQDTYTYPAGTTSFEEAHCYLTDSPSAYPVTLTISDGGSQTSTTSTSVTVNATPPALTDLAIVSTVNLGEASFLHGMVQNIGLHDGYSLLVNWADGDVAPYPYAPGSPRFTLNHTYLDAGSYQVSVTLSDNDGHAVERDHITAKVNQPGTEPDFVGPGSEPDVVSVSPPIDEGDPDSTPLEYTVSRCLAGGAPDTSGNLEVSYSLDCTPGFDCDLIYLHFRRIQGLPN